VFPLIFVPWLFVYEWFVYAGPPGRAFVTYLPGEINWPIWPWTEILYMSAYVLVPIAPLIAPTNRVLRRFVIAGVAAIVFGFLTFLTVPAISPPRPFEPTNVCGRMMLLDRWLDRNNGAASFPSFHVMWAFLGAAVLAHCSPRAGLRIAAWIWASAVAASCVLTGMHSLADILAGFAFFLLIHRFTAPPSTLPSSTGPAAHTAMRARQARRAPVSPPAIASRSPR